jgi:hypothetical protein
MEIAVPARPAAAPARVTPAADSAAAAVAAVPLFGSAMFLSGFLLFLVEPMVARMVLPILGGVPMVWNGCVVFFQIAMLAGYGYAFAASRWLPVRRHVVVHALLLATPALVLPVLIRPASVAPPTGPPLAWLLFILTTTIGLPFFVLSTTASVLQHWLSRTDHPSGGDPYFLYVASNAGCLLALASYPIVIEPTLTLSVQSRLWAWGYAVFAAMALACGTYAWRHQRTAARTAWPAVAAKPEAAVTAGRRVRWVVLAFVPSSLMLAVTSYISTDIAAVPLLWIVPLALYLLTFAVAFGRHAERVRPIAHRALPLAVIPLAVFMILGVREPLVPILLLHLGGFAIVALCCHGDLAADRPGASQLTEFYFWLSFGGMLGGLFNALVAPRLFNNVVEYPAVMLVGCLLMRNTVPAASRWRLLAPLAAGLMAATTLFAAGLPVPGAGGRVLYATRTFFGIYRVGEDRAGRNHVLAHGTTLHGMQSLDPARRREALTYFHSTGPFGEAWRELPLASRGHAIAVIGLGVGTLSTYATPDQRWTFFEIDPAIEQIARTPAYFTFLDACGDRCHVVQGDARLSLARVPERSYDLLVVDAFSSDSIPLHLMTREAMDLYLSRLTPGGSLLMHVSNRHLRLAPIVGRLAADRGAFAVRHLELQGPDWPEGKQPSDWIAISRNSGDLASLIVNNHWQPLAASPSTPLWTDDFSNLVSVLDVR